MSETADILDRAADHIDEVGWSCGGPTGVMREVVLWDGSGVCLEVAIAVAVGLGLERWTLVHHGTDYVEELLADLPWRERRRLMKQAAAARTAHDAVVTFIGLKAGSTLWPWNDAHAHGSLFAEGITESCSIPPPETAADVTYVLRACAKELRNIEAS